MDDAKLEKIKELRRTISYLSNQTQLATEKIEYDPAMAKLILHEMFSNPILKYY